VNGKKNLFLLLILIVLSSAYYLYDVKWAKETKKKKETNLKFIGSKETSNLIKLSFSGKKNTYVLKRDDKGFVITNPVSARVDEDEIKKILKVISQIREERRIGKVSSLSDFGLKKTSEKLAMTFKNSKDIVLKLGNITPTGKFKYLLLGNGEVATVDLSVLKKIDKKIFDIRDKYIITTMPDDANKISVFSSGMERIFDASRNLKNNKKWDLTYPINEQSDGVDTEGVVSTLRWDQVARFVDENPKDLSKYGLDTPKYIYHIFKNRSSKEPDDGVYIGEREINFSQIKVSKSKGKEKNKSFFYARRLRGGPVFLIKGHTMKSLPKTVFKIRKKGLIEYDVDHVTRIRFSWSGNIFDTIRKSKKDWDVTTKKTSDENSTKFKGRHKHIDDLLWDIKWSNAAGYIDNPKKDFSIYGFKSKGVRKFQIYMKKNKEEKEKISSFILGNLLDGKRAYGKFEDQKRVFLLDKKDYEKIVRTPEYFKDRRLVVFEKSENIRKLVVSYPDGKKMILRRPIAGLFSGTDNYSWEIANSEFIKIKDKKVDIKGQKVNIGEVDGFLNRLKDIEYEDKKINKDEYDFKNYRMIVSLYGKGEKKLNAIVFAKSRNKVHMIARRDSSKTEILPFKRQYNESRFPVKIQDWIQE